MTNDPDDELELNAAGEGVMTDYTDDDDDDEDEDEGGNEEVPEPQNIPVRSRRRMVVLDPVVAQQKVLNLRKQRRQDNKERFLKLLEEKHLGVICYAAKEAGISVGTINRWMRTDQNFHDRVRMVEHRQVGFVERHLFRAVANGNVRAMTFFLSTKGAKHGYVQGFELRTPEPLQVGVEVSTPDVRKEMNDEVLSKTLAKLIGMSPEMAAALQSTLVDKISDLSPED